MTSLTSFLILLCTPPTQNPDNALRILALASMEGKLPGAMLSEWDIACLSTTAQL
jgi:hypothetical protein